MRRFLYITMATIVVIEAASCSRPKSISGLLSTHSGLLSTQMAIGTGTDKHKVIVQYGYMKDGTVGYIAFTVATKPQEASGIVTTGSDSKGSQHASLKKPNGETIELPSDVQLFECIDGQYSESKKKVDREVFEAFLASKPKEYSIRALLSFVEEKAKSERNRGP